MIGELDLGGVIVPSLLALAVAALLVSAVLRRLLDALGFYRIVWHRALFDLCLFAIVLGGLVLLTAQWRPA